MTETMSNMSLIMLTMQQDQKVEYSIKNTRHNLKTTPIRISHVSNKRETNQLINKQIEAIIR